MRRAFLVCNEEGGEKIQRIELVCRLMTEATPVLYLGKYGGDAYIKIINDYINGMVKAGIIKKISRNMCQREFKKIKIPVG